MAKGKYKTWLNPQKLELVTNWVANGTDIDCARNMGISKQTFYVWEKEHPAFSDAVKRGREARVPSMENLFHDVARGGITVTETIEEFRGELRNGKPHNGTIVKRTVKKQLPPNPGAIMFYLKNKAGYRSEPTMQDEKPSDTTIIVLGVEPERADD